MEKRIIEMGMCFNEQFVKGGDYSYEECLDYCDFIFENYEKIGVLK